MNDQPQPQPIQHVGTRTRVCCPICGHQCVQISNVSMFKPVPGETTQSDYYRLDSEHGVVAMRHGDPTTPVTGRLVVVQLHGECGHDFDFVLHNNGSQTLFAQASDHAMPTMPNQEPPAPPQMFLTPAVWMAFLRETKDMDSTAHGALLTAVPLLDRPRHLVLCYSLEVPQVVEYMRRDRVRTLLADILEELVGEGWKIEILTSHFLNQV